MVLNRSCATKHYDCWGRFGPSMIKMGPQRFLGAIMRPLRPKIDHFEGEV